MNNSWHRLKTSLRRTEGEQLVVRIQHPAPIAPGGWMETLAEEAVAVQAKGVAAGGGATKEDKVVPTMRTDLPVISHAELARHSNKCVACNLCITDCCVCSDPLTL